MRSQRELRPVHLWRDGEWGAIQADDVEGFGSGGGGRVDGAVVAGAVVGTTSADCRIFNRLSFRSKKFRCSPVVIGYHIAVGILIVELAPLQTGGDPPRPPRIRTAENENEI